MKLSLLPFLVILSCLMFSNEDLHWLFLQLFLVISLLNFLSPWNHILLSLLNLELISLLTVASFTLLPLSGFNPEFYFTFFTLAVCEASIGIAILIFFSHSKGSESLSSLMTLF